MECYNFINNQLTPESHPLFATEKKFDVIKLMEDNETADIRRKFQRSGLLPWVTLKSVYVVSWDACFATKYKNKAILAYDADPAALLPKFGKIESIYQVLGFIYFELTKFNTKVLVKHFNHMKYTRTLITAQQLFPMIIFSIITCIIRKQLLIMALLFL